jgi:hypothetical protein
LSFPFKVKRVKDNSDSFNVKTSFDLGSITTVWDIVNSVKFGYITTNDYLDENAKRLYHQCAEIQDYILFEEN